MKGAASVVVVKWDRLCNVELLTGINPKQIYGRQETVVAVSSTNLDSLASIQRTTLTPWPLYSHNLDLLEHDSDVVALMRVSQGTGAAPGWIVSTSKGHYTGHENGDKWW
ncbi:hypothetical protein Pmani_022720 [Petrolisthes manimaculis]|uniref:Uncharacterized protein n=1 Tax=Petrolisthes manimaculis TaxID=1843537 RepID=A0AAE1PBG2_9EUCA|nr:hypothetical protein Pmani_022720 [Petrolisthes manimaculis]